MVPRLGAGGTGWGGYLSPFMILLRSCVVIAVFWARRKAESRF